MLVNPYGGSNMGEPTFKEVLQPMFEKANVDYDFVRTTHASHAFEVCIGFLHPFHTTIAWKLT